MKLESESDRRAQAEDDLIAPIAIGRVDELHVGGDVPPGSDGAIVEKLDALLVLEIDRRLDRALEVVAKVVVEVARA